MKGLVRKDLTLMLKMNKTIILIMYLFVMAIAFLNKDEIYAITSSAFFSLFIGMHLMMTMTYDGMTSWKQYELTLPISKPIRKIINKKGRNSFKMAVKRTREPGLPYMFAKFDFIDFAPCVYIRFCYRYKY